MCPELIKISSASLLDEQCFRFGQGKARSVKESIKGWHVKSYMMGFTMTVGWQCSRGVGGVEVALNL